MENKEKIENQEKKGNCVEGATSCEQAQNPDTAVPDVAVNEQETADGIADKVGERDEKYAELLEKIINLTAEKDQYLNMAQRYKADYENYRRRNINAVSEAYESGMQECIKQILPVIDNLERAVEAAEKNEALGAFLDGVEMILKEFKEILSRMGLEEIDAYLKPFDPELHNAVMQVEAEDGQEEGTVIEVFQKGYKMKDKVLRYSMVKVAK